MGLFSDKKWGWLYKDKKCGYQVHDVVRMLFFLFNSIFSVKIPGTVNEHKRQHQTASQSPDLNIIESLWKGWKTHHEVDFPSVILQRTKVLLLANSFYVHSSES